LPSCIPAPNEWWPYRLPTVLTNNGARITPQPHQFLPGEHNFDRICREYGVEHRLTKPAHLWTNGQVERMSCTIKEATVQRFHYQTTDELNEHLQAFLLAYNHAKRLKTLRGLTPHEFVCAQLSKNPTISTRDPTNLTLGLYI
jgi:transposase InsO family protein